MNEQPYLGLRPYQEVDQHNFYGRDADCEILIDKLLANRLTLLFAASGVGKSSLLNAAVLPRLKDPLGENLSVVYHNDWVQNPLSLLQESIRDVVPSAKEAPANQTLAELLSFCTLFTRHPFVLVLDQFEEFFRYQRGKPDFDSVVQQLTTLVINPDIPVSIVISMREDFALELNAFKPKLPTLLFENYYRLEKMKPEAARDAIVKPAENVGHRYEPELLTRLVDDLSSHHRQQVQLPHERSAENDKYVEPAYLQIVCSHLWELNKSDSEQVIRLTLYDESGGSTGIVKHFVDNVQDSFSTAEKYLSSKAFDYLAAQGGVKMAYPAKILARIIKVNEKKLVKVLGKLATEDVRILRSQPRENVVWYELYHDMFSPSIERWNNDWKAKQLRRQRWITGGLITLLILLVEPFMWVWGNNFPVTELLSQYKYRLMDWGLLDEPFPEMIQIKVPRQVFKVGEQDNEFGEMATAFLKKQGAHGQQNFGYPPAEVGLEKDFEIGKYEVTYTQYDYFVWQQKKVRYPSAALRGQRPVTNVSWNDAIAYTQWLSDKTGRLYRLPSEVEWEYAARGGRNTAYFNGDEIGQNNANCDGCGSLWDKFSVAPVGSFEANNFGLHDTAGNAWEWTCSEWKAEFNGSEGVCKSLKEVDGNRVIRGGSWNTATEWLRSSARLRSNTGHRPDNVGFRVIGFPRTN